MTTQPDFQPWPKMARLSREVIITEKIDGTNAQIYITEDGQMFTGSRRRWVTPLDDNYGFAAWCVDNREELMKLGPGRHFGEWWGRGIQRGYGLNERRFSLFNVSRWKKQGMIDAGASLYIEGAIEVPPCCHVVPALCQMSEFQASDTDKIMRRFWKCGSHAALGFMRPEGIIAFHTAAGIGFKKTFEHDMTGKDRAA